MTLTGPASLRGLAKSMTVDFATVRPHRRCDEGNTSACLFGRRLALHQSNSGW